MPSGSCTSICRVERSEPSGPDLFCNSLLTSTFIGAAPPISEITLMVVGATGFSPLLNQIFFIGDGLTGDGSGSVQSFLAPVGATRLFLAVADSIGSSDGNSGSLSVTYNATPGGAVQEPASWALMIAGFGLAGASLRRRRVLTAT